MFKSCKWAQVSLDRSTVPLTSELGTLWQDGLGPVDALRLPRLCYLLYLFPTQLLHLNPTVKLPLDIIKTKTSCSSFHTALLLEWLQIPTPPQGLGEVRLFVLCPVIYLHPLSRRDCLPHTLPTNFSLSPSSFRNQQKKG